jgi:uncharacterized membrane protein YccC
MALAGAMTVLYARGEPYVHRARTVLAFALLIITMSTAALLVSGARWWLLILLTVMAGVAAAATETMRTPVPGPALLLVPVTIVVGIPFHHTSELIHRVAMMGIGAGVALVVTLAPWLICRQGPERRALLGAYRAIADAICSAGTPGFDAARAAAWAAVDSAQQALALARHVPGRDAAEVGRLCALGDRAPLLLHAAELAALERGAALPADMLTRAQALPSAVGGTTADSSAPTSDSAPSVSHARQALDQEMRRVLAGPKWSSTETLPAADTTRCAPPQRIRPLRRRERAIVVRVALLTLASGATTILTGLDRWYWAPVCAVATLWGSHTWMTWYRAAQRGLATVVGGFVGMALLQPHLPFPVATVLVAVLFFLAELSFPRNYGLAMLFVTPMVLLTIHGANSIPLDASALSWDRITTTLIGCVFGVLGVLVFLPSPSTHLLADRIARSVRLQQALLTEILATPSDAHARLCVLVRRDLAELDTLAADALGEARSGEQARALWPVAVSVRHLGYLLLALSALKPECWPEMGHSDWRRRGLEEAAAASLYELSAPRADLQPILNRELQIMRSLLLPHPA